MPPSSSGPRRRVLCALTPVRIRLGVHVPDLTPGASLAAGLSRPPDYGSRESNPRTEVLATP